MSETWPACCIEADTKMRLAVHGDAALEQILKLLFDTHSDQKLHGAHTLQALSWPESKASHRLLSSPMWSLLCNQVQL